MKRQRVQTASASQTAPAPEPPAPAAAKTDTPRDRNLAFKYQEPKTPTALAFVTGLFRPAHSANKDGVSLTDHERLYLFVEARLEQGYSKAALIHEVNLFFFGGLSGSPGRGLDRIASVSLEGGSVTVTFEPDLAGGPILPLIADAPTAHPGVDTNLRGDLVSALELDAEIRGPGSWVDLRRDQVVQAFLRSDVGQGFVGQAPELRDQDPSFRRAFHAFCQQSAINYMIWAPEWVEQQLGDVSGKDPDAILSEALDLALLWANPSIGAAPHRVIETQDEAVAQKVLQSLGFRTDVDTDLEQARVNAGP